MKLIKKINNNFVLAEDSKGEKIIVEGKGIGFQKMPCELADLSIITRTYYNTKEQEISLIKSVPDDLLEISSQIHDMANRVVGARLNSNLTLILADHIQFSLERIKNHMNLKMPIYYDIEHLYPEESMIAEYAIKLIRRELLREYPDSEKTGIALSIINSEYIVSEGKEKKDKIVELCTSIIENMFSIKIHKESFSYSRFVTHMEYLMQRAKKKREASDENMKLYQSVADSAPHIHTCVDKIEMELSRNGYYINEEEKMYLILHINRLCNREDCHR